MKDITPDRYKCGVSLQCPAIYDLGGGQYAVKGELIGIDGTEATIKVDPQIIIAALKEQLWSEK